MLLLSTIRDTDLILVLEKGKIVERGTHDELMERQGLYYYLSSQQLPSQYHSAVAHGSRQRITN